MAVEIEMKPELKPFPAHSCRKLVPYRVAMYKALVAGGDQHARFKEVQEKVLIGDVCVFLQDNQTYSARLFLCRQGILCPHWYLDYLLFEDALDVKRVVIAKPEN